jgi:hypothetical protein
MTAQPTPSSAAPTGVGGKTAKGAGLTGLPLTARRVTINQARAHHAAGGWILVSEYGHQRTRAVGENSTVHNDRTTNFDALLAMVREWRNRYPNQRFYTVGAPGRG